MILFKRILCASLGSDPVPTSADNISNISSGVARKLVHLSCHIDEILPERKADLRDLQLRDFIIEIDSESGHFRFGAQHRLAKLVVSVAALERLWCNLFFSLSAFEVFKREGRQGVYDSVNYREMRLPQALAVFAHYGEQANVRFRLLDELISSFLDRSDALVQSTDTYFNYVCCFMLLHEIQHLQLHNGGVELDDQSRKMEREADEAAIRFMLDDWTKSSNQGEYYCGRCAGILVGLASLASVEFYGRKTGTTHPELTVRLDRALEIVRPTLQEFGNRLADYPVYLAASVIYSHILNAGISFNHSEPFQDVDSFWLAVHQAIRKVE